MKSSQISFMKRSMPTNDPFRPRFFEPMPTLQRVPIRHDDDGTPVYHDEVIGSSGRAYPCAVIYKCIDDVLDHELITYDQSVHQGQAVADHQYSGILPGSRRFYSPYSGEYVYFVELLDDYIEMYTMAMNFWDLTDSEEENEDPMQVDDLWARPFPTNIGAFRLYGEIVRRDSYEMYRTTSETEGETDEDTTDGGESTTEN